MRAFIFPGQGSQYIGMGQSLYQTYAEAKDVFQEVDDTLSQNLSELMFSGDAETLSLTANTQPALMAVSVAVARVLQKQGGFQLKDKAAYVAGHSLGEYSALTAVGVLELADTARLLRLRGDAMQRAVPVGKGGMAAIIGLTEFADVRALAEEATQKTGKICETANDNAPGQVVISGEIEAIEAAIEMAKEKGAKRALSLPVSAPFHSSLMAPAAQEMGQALASTDFRPPAIPVVANVTAEGENDPGQLRRLLVEQITGAVRWRESGLWMKGEGVSEYIELGAGKVLSGLMKRIDKEASATAIETPEQIDAFLENLHASKAAE